GGGSQLLSRCGDVLAAARTTTSAGAGALQRGDAGILATRELGRRKRVRRPGGAALSRAGRDAALRRHALGARLFRDRDGSRAHFSGEGRSLRTCASHATSGAPTP